MMSMKLGIILVVEFINKEGGIETKYIRTSQLSVYI